MRVLAFCAALILFPAVHARHAKPAPASTFFSLFEPVKETHAVRPVRHASHIRRVSLRGADSRSSFVLGNSDNGSALVAEARSQVGNGPIYGRSNLWCARFVNWVLAKLGYKGTGSDAAASFSALPATSMHPGAIAVLSRRGGGHVGIVSGATAAGDPILISGNNAGRVREGAVARGRVLRYVEAQ